MPVKKLNINSDNENRRLDNYLMNRLKNIPKTNIYKMIRKGEIRVNSKRIKPLYKLKSGDEIRLPPFINIDSTSNSNEYYSDKFLKDFKKNILFSNSNYLVINKPYGLSVHGGTATKSNLISIIRKIYNYENIDLCHRIDKHTSGCIVVSLNKKANISFNRCLLKNEVQKVYKAIVKGSIGNDIEIENELFSRNHKTKSSLSYFSPIKKLKKSTLIQVKIETGRTHQIRKHANSINHPILNDYKYGDDKYNKLMNDLVNNRMYLHSFTISFNDTNGTLISCEAPLDDSFNDAINKLS